MATGVFATALTSIGVASVSGANDYFTVHDASATELKKIQAADVLKRFLSSTDISWMSALANIGAVSMANDKFFVWDADASQIKTLTATEIGDRLLTTLDIGALSALADLGAVDQAADSFLVWDNDANVFKTLNALEIVGRFWRGYLNTMTATPYTGVTSAKHGQVFANTGAAVAITVSLPAAAAGLRYAFIRVADYDITLDPNGSETINGGDTYVISAPGRVDLECFVTGAWVITSNSTISASGVSPGTFNVRTYGAVGNNSTNCSPAFQAAAALCLTKTSTILVPESTEAVTPAYRLNTGNYLASLGTLASTIPGGMTDLRGRILLVTGPLILPAGHQIIGRVPAAGNDASPMASEIWAASGYAGTGSRLVQIGRDDYISSDVFPDTTRIEKTSVNGRSQSGIVGVFSNSMQEACGIFDCVVYGCHHGIIATSGANIAPGNFEIARNHLIFTTANCGNGIYSFGHNYRIIKNTLVTRDTTTIGDTAIILRGTNAKAEDCHVEGWEYGVDIGGPDTGVGEDNGFWTFNIEVNGLTGHNLQFGAYSQPSMTSLVRIRADDTHVFNVTLRNLSLLDYNGTVNIVDDQVNGIAIPAASNDLELAYYHFGGSLLQGDSGSATKRPVYTSYYDHLGAENDAVMAAAVAGTTNDLATTFGSGARVGILQITSSATPILTSLAGGRTGRVIYGHNLTGSTLVLDHAAGTGTAANRFLCSTSADINIAVGSYFRATYGDILGQPIDGTNYASRWYVEAV